MMTVSVPEQILCKIDEVKILYHRLVLVAVWPGGGKTQALQAVAQQTGLPLVNLNLELSRHLLDLTERQRVMRVSRLLSEVVSNYDTETVLLDNTEILFDPTLKQNPLALLQGVARNTVIVAAWNGMVDKGYLTYASPDHPEYRRYPARELAIISVSAPDAV